MFVISLKSFLAKKFRLLSTAVAVMLGVAFLSGSLVLIDTLGRTFDSLVAGIYEGTDAQVRSTELLETAFQDIRGPVDESLLAEVLAVEGVSAASPSVDGFAQIVGSDGTALGNPAQGAPTIGVNWAEVSELNPMVLEPGSRPPAGPGEVAIDKTSAEKGELAVGDTVTILLAGPPLEFEIVGVATFGEANSLAGASLAMFDTATAQDVLDSQGKYRSIEVVARAGVSQTELRARLASALTGDVEVITGDEVIEESQSAIADALGFFNTFMLVFAGVALFVAAFIIYNTFSILVAQRTKEMALLRALGASGRQILGSVLFEALIVGIIASVVGIVGGLGVAIGLKQMMTSLGIEIPGGSVVFATSTIVTCMIVGLVVTSVSAVAPALRAARTPPMAAIREVATDSSGHSIVRFVLGGLLTGSGVAAVLFSLFGGPSSPLQILGIGAVAVFLGVAALGPIIAAPVATAMGAVMTPLRGFPGQIAGENAGRNPKRTSATASALMIGIALVGFITIFAASTRSTIDKIIDDSVRGDIVIESSSFGFGGLSPVLAEEVAALPEVEAAAGMRVGFAEVNGDAEMLIGGDPSQIGQVVNFGVIEGRIEDLGVAGIAVQADHAEDEGLTLGDGLSIRFADSGVQTFTVAALYDQMDDRYFIANAAFEANFDQVFDVQIFVQTADGVLPDTAREAVEAAAAPYANATVEDLSEFKAAQAEPVDQLLGLVYALLGLSILIAVLGIANTLALSIVERTHEIGLLRAVGMTQRQVRAAVRWESVIIALLGTGLGIGIGTFFGWSIVTALKDEGFEVLTIPPLQLLIVAILGIVVGVLAAVGPARRAAKLNVLQAISTD